MATFVLVTALHPPPDARLGVYPGSFNPPTVAHLKIALTAREHHGLHRVDFAVSTITLGKESVMRPPFEERLAVRRETFVNRVRYPDPEAVMTYWRASTFFDAKHADAIESDVKKHFDDHDEFVVEKHVMAAIGIADA